MNYDLILPTHKNDTLKHGSLNVVLMAFRQSKFNPNEIYIVNNGEIEDSCRHWLKNEICPKYSARYIEINEASRAKARNVGAAKSSADYLLFCDDDVVPSDDAIGLAVERSSQEHFCAGARRRFLAMKSKKSEILKLVKEKQWDGLNCLANDTRIPETSLTADYKGIQYHSTYIGCFGLLPKWAFNKVGGFDERFEGWGLEDTELMRRLLTLVGFRSLRESTVWHLDHLVSPYIWEEHWGKNLRLYCDRQREKPMLEICRLFNRDECEANDPTILIPPPQSSGETKRLESLKTNNNVKSIIDNYTHFVEKDPNVAALVLFGSALYKERPADIDFDQILFIGDTSCKKFKTNGIYIDEHKVRMSTLQSTLHKPFFYPETWPWMVSRYIDGIYLHQKVDLKSMIYNEIEQILSRSALHLLTFHLGRIFQSLERTHYADRLSCLKDVAVLGCINEGIFPDQMHYPYCKRASITGLLSKVERILVGDHSGDPIEVLISDLLIPVTGIIKKFRMEDRINLVYYTASEIGLNIIYRMGYVDISAKWGKITNYHSDKQNFLRQYGIQHSDEHNIITLYGIHDEDTDTNEVVDLRHSELMPK